ncbi:hypothetical protein SAMN04487957_104219 [Halomonas shengliensis]|uniref:Uncharacterized protein n=1 Tax=Halomonas shengliensis TaxID=419597 RepID=A0A1H0HLH1_9GAMM|nr:hypothetical protein [Halomonas shengliensis]SDO20025.1 hypothetical protein SAMN04487957_104219 [Halomonas shengliensis]
MTITNAADLAATIIRQAERRDAIATRLANLAESDTHERLTHAEAVERDAAERLWRAFAPSEQWANVPEVEEVRAAAERRTPRGLDNLGTDRDAHFNGCRDHLERATGTVAELSEAWQAEAEERAALEEELAEVNAAGHGVPTTRKGLARLTDAIAGQRAELARVNQALADLETGESDAGAAAAELEAAQQRVDDLAAAEALGEVDEAEQRAAATALTKARQRAAGPGESRKLGEAAHRGLERKAEALAAGIDHLEHAAREVEADVCRDEWAEAERRLVELLEGEELAHTMERLREARAAYSRACRAADRDTPATVGGDRLEISGPLLTHHRMRWPLRV